MERAGRAVMTPGRRLLAAVLICLAAAGGVLWLAVNQPFLGVTLTYDDAAGGAKVMHAAGPSAHIPPGAVIASVSGGGEDMALEAIDFTLEPDSMTLFADYDRLIARQNVLSRIQAADAMTLTATDGRQWTVQPDARRPLRSLTASFWVQLSVGAAAWLIAACIWAFRPATAAARYLLLSGAATLTFSPAAAIYTTREFALDGTLFRAASDIQFLGGCLFLASMIALLLHYPRRIAPAWAGLGVVALMVVWWIVQQMGAFETVTLARRVSMLVLLPSTFILAAVHWRGTRTDPVARAALQWFLLSWLVITTVFAVGILLPQMLGVDNTAYQGYSFLLFLLVYLGLAFGIAKFRLFELGVWWMRTVIWTVTVAVLIGLDLVLALVLQLSGAASLSLALLGCAAVWLPLRSWLWGRFFREADTGDRAVFEHVVAVGFAASVDEQRARWRDVLTLLFRPLHMAETDAAPERPSLVEDGLALLIPGAGALPPMRLEYARGGRRLFTRADEAAAADALGMLRHVLESRRAYEQGVGEERRRISSDIHDNVGARLLSALHSDGEEAKNSRIRETMSDLRTIVNDAAGRAASLDEALADLRVETAERLAARGVTLDWPLTGAPAAPLSAAQTLALRSILREAVSNALKHASPSRVRVGAEYGRTGVTISVEDDGPGFDPEAARQGSGLDNMRRRAGTLGGEARWSRGAEGGACVTFTLPLAEVRSAAE